MKPISYFRLLYTPAFLLVAFFLFAACDKDDEPEITSLQLRNDPTLGSYLADSAGRTLYVFSRDVSGQSLCSGSCLTAWPVFYSGTLRLPKELKATDFATITRSDGSKQSTFKGWPLYYYDQDLAAGDVKGENVNNVWFVVNPDFKLMVARQGTDLYLTDMDGRALYTFSPDGVNQSTCNGPCLANWPAFLAENFKMPSLLSSTDFQTITRSDGAKQLSYKGKPLYYFVNDSQRGDIKGKDVGNVWFLATP